MSPIRKALARLPLLALALGLALTLPLAPVRAALPAADEQAIRHVVLTDGLLDKLVAIKAEGKAMGIKKAEANPAALTSLDAMARVATRDPRTVGLLARHQISARNYAAASIAIVRASMAAQLGTSAGVNGTTPANVAFAKSRMGKIRALFMDDDGDE